VPAARYLIVAVSIAMLALIGSEALIAPTPAEEGSYAFLASELPFPRAGTPRALIVFLHGRGHQSLAKLKVRSLQIAYYARPALDAVVVAPYCPSCERWSVSQLSELFSARQREFQTGTRLYVIGFSMGGFAAWQIAEELPDQVSAVVPIAGGAWPGPRCGHVPVWAFHGTEDTVVPPQATAEMAADYEKCGQHPRVTFMPGVGHSLRLRLVAAEGLFPWLGSQE
jgi:pimeloyl-ACP methyl ester carboxylesterase